MRQKGTAVAEKNYNAKNGQWEREWMETTPSTFYILSGAKIHEDFRWMGCTASEHSTDSQTWFLTKKILSFNPSPVPQYPRKRIQNNLKEKCNWKIYCTIYLRIMCMYICLNHKMNFKIYLSLILKLLLYVYLRNGVMLHARYSFVCNKLAGSWGIMDKGVYSGVKFR